MSEISGMKTKTYNVMCQLEKVFPPGFFDIQVHFVTHLVEEVEIAGTVHARWMFWVERYMKVLKGYVRQMAKAEGCMVAGHLHYEALFYASRAVELFDCRAPSAWEEADANETTCNMKTLGKRTEHTLSGVQKYQVHQYVLLNDDRMAPFLSEYRDWEKLQRGPSMGFLEWARRRVDGLIETRGRQAVSEDVMSILRGPSDIAGSYTHMRESGRHFRVHSLDRIRISTSDSGIYALSLGEDEEGAMMPYCGILKEILEVDFESFQVILLGASWYRVVTQGDNATVKLDPCGFHRVNTSFTNPRNRRDSDNWIYPRQVDQCFYVPIKERIRNHKWSVVVPVFPRRHKLYIRQPLEEDVEAEDQ